MKRKILKFCNLFLAVTLFACGGGGGGGGGGSPANIPRFAYVSNSAANTVSLYTVDAATGRVRHNGYVNVGAFPTQMAVHPSNRFLYVLDGGLDKLSAFAIDSRTGALTPIDADASNPGLQATIATGVEPVAIALDPSGKFLYVANFDSSANPGSAEISAYMVDTDTGALTPVDADGNPANGVQNFPAGKGSQSIGVDPSGRFVYAVNFLSQDISAFKIVTGGALVPIGQPVLAGGQPEAAGIDPLGRFVYVATLTGSGSTYTISAFSITGTGALNPIAGSTPDAPGEPSSLVIDPTGSFVYAVGALAGSTPGKLSGYRIEASTGTLTAVPGSPFTTGIDPTSVSVDPSGKFVYVSNEFSDAVSFYSIDPASGALGTPGQISTQSHPFGFTMAAGTGPVTYTPTFAYVADGFDNTISAFNVNPSSGTLSQIGSPVTAGTNPSSVAVDPSGRFLYAAHRDSANVSAYKITPGAGTLNPIASVPFGAGTSPVSVAVDPSGRFAYVANSGTLGSTTDPGSIQAYQIDPGSGALGNLNGAATPTTVAAGTNPLAITVDPSGRFAYAANFTSNDVSAYSINPQTGELSPIGTTTFQAGTGPDSATVDPTGQYLYVANFTSGDVAAYVIDPESGAPLTRLDSNGASGIQNFLAGGAAAGLAVDLTGSFLFVTNDKAPAGKNLTGLVIGTNTDPDPGAPSTGMPGTPFATGSQPVGIAVDPSGKFVYVANTHSNSISAYFLDFGPTLTAISGTDFPTGQGPNAIAVTGTIQ